MNIVKSMPTARDLNLLVRNTVGTHSSSAGSPRFLRGVALLIQHYHESDEPDVSSSMKLFAEEHLELAALLSKENLEEDAEKDAQVTFSILRDAPFKAVIYELNIIAYVLTSLGEANLTEAQREFAQTLRHTEGFVEGYAEGWRF